MKMRNYTSYILATILFFTGIASAQAQSMTANVTKATGEYELVSYDNSWHVVKGTGVKVTLNGVTVPESSNEKRYENTLTYKKEGLPLQAQDGTDIFEVTQDLTVNFTAIATYQLYKQEEGTGNWIPEGNPQDETVGNITVIFKAYNAPDIDDFTVSSPIKYTYNTANPITFTAEYSYSTEANGLTYAIDWKQNSTSVKTGGDKTYELSTNNIGEFNIEATLSVYAPDKQTTWAVKTANKTVKIFNKPAVNGISPAREYTLVGDNEFNVTVNISKDSEITADIQWNGGVTGTEITGYFNPNTVGTFPISATVIFKDPEGNNLLNPISSESVTVTVYNIPTFTGITPEKKYTVKGSTEFNVTANVTKDSRITTSVKWSEEVSGTTEIGKFNPTSVGTFSISATVTFKDPNGDVLITLPKQNGQPVTTDILVYNRPTVTDITPNRYYALAGDSPFKVELTIDNPDNLEFDVDWDGDIQKTNDILKGDFNPNTVGTFPISATVTFKDPEGNKLLDPITSKSKTITVYNIPTFTGITPEKKYTVKGSTEFNVTANVTKDSRITTSVKWSEEVSGTTEIGKFNPTSVGTFSISATVTFKDPNGDVLITLPRQNGQPVTTDIKVFNNPIVQGIRFLPDDSDITYTNNTTDVKVYWEDGNIDEGIDVIVERWAATAGNIEKAGDVTAKYTAPSVEYDNVTITANISFKVNGEILTTDSETKSFEVRALALVLEKDVTYVGNNKFSIYIDGYDEMENHWKGINSNWNLSWELSVNDELKKSGETGSTINYDFNGFDISGEEPQTTKVTVTVYRQYGNNTPSSKMSLSTNVDVYKKPIINEAKISTDSELTCVGQKRTLTARVKYSPTSLPIRVEWYKNNAENPFESKTEKVNSNEQGYYEIGCDYTPSSDDSGSKPSFTTKIYVCNPDGKECWTDAYTDATPAIITVYPKPDVAVSEEMLQNEITENVGDNANVPEKIVGYEGQPEQKFNYKVNDLNTNYYWTYSWQLLDENKELVSGNEPKTGKESSFDNLTEGIYYVKLTANAFNNNKHDEKWGEQTYISSPITIYSAPQYQQLDYHLKESTEHKYSIYTGKVFDASKLFSYKKNDGSNTGYPTGWEKTLYVSKNGETEIENKDNNGNPSLIFEPKETGEYSLKLRITNKAPTGTWYDSEKLALEHYTYSLYVYPQPEIENNNISTLFDNPNESGKYTLHVVSEQEIPFEFTIKGGDEGEVNSNWKVTHSINSKTPESFTKNGTKYNYTFQERSDEKTVYSFDISVSDTLKYLVKDQEPFYKGFSGTITVWKEIAATIAAPNTNTEGKYMLETRVGDNDKQEIKIRLAGGDPTKWIITPTTNSNPVGNSSQNEYDYTYTIQDSKFTTEGTYPYYFTAQYKDGLTDVSSLEQQSIDIIVYPEPVIRQVLALNNVNKNVKYIEQSESYNITCYESDELGMTVTPTGGKTNETWKYQIGTGSKTDIPSNSSINIDGNGTKTIKFYNYLGTKEKEVKTIGAQITRKPDPEIKNILPTVDNTTAEVWNAAKDATKRIDLYGDASKPQFSRATFDFSPNSGHEGYENGWDYSWKINDTEQSKNKGLWSYQASNSSNNAYEDQAITVSIKNSIPAGAGQEGENVGLYDTKIYYVRVWREASLPSEDYSITDEYNYSNDVKTTHAIREGNKLTAMVAPIEFGYSNNNFYEWKGQGAQANMTNWENIMSNSDTSDSPGKSKTTYGLHVYNKGPRGTIWAEKTFADCDVDIYNKPKTPTSLVIKGQGSQVGTSGTVIIEYSDISDAELISRGDYVIDFCYTDTYGDQLIIAKPQTKKGDIRWATGYSGIQQENAFVYSHWLDEENGVLITSGKRTRNGIDETFDLSKYNLSSSDVTEIREITRAGSGNYEDIIHSIDSNKIAEDEISIYNMKGIKVGSSMQGLTPGMYVIRYLQDGVIKSKKLSVK